MVAYPERWVTRAWRWARRHPTWSMWIAAIGLIDGCILLPFWVLYLSAEELFVNNDVNSLYIIRSIILTMCSPLLVAFACQAGGLIGLLGGAGLGAVKGRIKMMALQGARLGVKVSLILASAAIILNVCLTLGLWATTRSKPPDQRMTVEEESICESIAERYKGLARRLATSLSPRYRNPEEAVRLASIAVEMYLKDPSTLGTLGVAQYRAGNWDGAIGALENALDRYANGSTLSRFLPTLSRVDIVEGLFLAMAYHQKGQSLQVA